MSEDGSELQQSIIKFLEDQEQTPTIDTPISSSIRQIDGDVTSLNMDDSSFTLIVNHPHVEIVLMQTNVWADQPHVDDNSTWRVVDFRKKLRLCPPKKLSNT